MKTDQVALLIQELRSLKLRESLLLDELEVASGRSSSNARASSTLSVGDRIRVRNLIRKPSDWTRPWKTSISRLATITAVQNDRVYFITDNGLETGRAMKNVERLNTNE